MDTKDRLLTPTEVATLFRVDPKTVTRWAASGRMSRIRTPGGHSRFRESEVRALLEENGAEDVSDLIPQQPTSETADRAGTAAPVAAPASVPAEVAARNNRGW